MTGFEASIEIKRLISEEGYQNCIIIANSADSSEDHTKKCKDNKMDEIFEKPE